MKSNPPPLAENSGTFYRGAATLSWASVILSILTNVFLESAHLPPSRESSLTRALILLVIMLAGVVSGIVALCGIPQHGRRGLLWPVVTGLGIWALLLAIAIPPFMNARRKALAIASQKPTTLSLVERIPNAQRIEDGELRVAFDMPKGYESLPVENRPKGYQHAFVKPAASGPSHVLLVRGLGGTLPREHLKAKDVPAGQSASLELVDWRGLQGDAIRSVAAAPGDVKFVSLTVQIPLQGQAVQMEFGGPLQQEAEMRSTVAKVLASFDGATNW